MVSHPHPFPRPFPTTGQLLLSDPLSPIPLPCLVIGPAERSPLINVLREAWTEVDQGLAQARWWATIAGYVIGLGLILLVLLCALAAGGGIKEIAILLWTPNVGLVLGAGAFYLFHMQEAKSLCRVRAELQHVLGRARETQDLSPESEQALLLGQQEGDRAEEQ